MSEIRNANLTAWYEPVLESAPHYGALAKKVIELLKLGHEQELLESNRPTFRVRFVTSKRRNLLGSEAICKLVGALDGLYTRVRSTH